MDYSQVADVITQHAAPGDCLIMDNTATWKPGPIRPLTAARAAAHEKLIDPGRGARAATRNRLWHAHLGIWGVADRVRQCTVLWTVSERDNTLGDRDSGPALGPGPSLGRAPPTGSRSSSAFTSSRDGSSASPRSPSPPGSRRGE